MRVSYEALPGPGDYEFVRADVDRQLPLRNLHWVRTTGANRTIRTIQSLSVDFRPLSAFGANQTALSLLERPYLNLLFVVCDVSAAILPGSEAHPQAITGQRDIPGNYTHADQRMARLGARSTEPGVAHCARD